MTKTHPYLPVLLLGGAHHGAVVRHPIVMARVQDGTLDTLNMHPDVYRVQPLIHENREMGRRWAVADGFEVVRVGLARMILHPELPHVREYDRQAVEKALDQKAAEPGVRVIELTRRVWMEEEPARWFGHFCAVRPMPARPVVSEPVAGAASAGRL